MVDGLCLRLVPGNAERDKQRVEMLRRRVRRLGMGRLLLVVFHVIVPDAITSRRRIVTITRKSLCKTVMAVASRHQLSITFRREVSP